MRRAFQRLRSGRGGPVLVEVPNDVWAEECDPSDYVCPKADAHRHRPRRRARGRQDAGRGQAAGDLRRPGRALGRGLGRAEGAGRAAGHSGHDQPRRQERVPRDAPAVARLGRPRHPADGAHLPRQVGPDPRHRLLVHGDQLRRQDAGRREDHPRDARPLRHQQGHPRARWASLGDAKLVLQALLAEVQKLHGKSPKDPKAVAKRDRRHLRALARQVDAEAHRRQRAAQPLPRAVGPAEDGRRRQHHHHPRRRQPARPALAVLAADHAALLHRLGQDHPARHGARPRDGRQARQARQALHQRVGRRGDRLHRHGLRDGRARADPDPVDPAQQLLDGDRAEGDAGRRPRSTARPTSPATTRPWRARSAATASGSRSRATSSPAIKRGIAATEKGQPALLEFITSKEVDVSRL